MRITPIQQTQNIRRQSFKANVVPIGNAKTVFERYGTEFEDCFVELMSPLGQIKRGTIVSISAPRETQRSQIFHIEFFGRNSVHKEYNISIPNQLGPIEKALKLASAVFKPFIQAGKITKKNAYRVAKGA